MRVTCTGVESFIVNLKEEGAEKILGKTVWGNISTREIDEVRREVNVQATCIVEIGEGEYLLQYGEDCGTDYYDKSQEFKATEKANEIMKEISECCEGLGLEIRPGVVDF